MNIAKRTNRIESAIAEVRRQWEASGSIWTLDQQNAAWDQAAEAVDREDEEEEEEEEEEKEE